MLTKDDEVRLAQAIEGGREAEWSCCAEGEGDDPVEAP